MNKFTKTTIKSALRCLARWSATVDKYYNKWGLLGPVPLGLLVANFFFQRILRINGNVEFPVHFTSRVIFPHRLKVCQDQMTMKSFSLSHGCYIQAINGIEIGYNFLFAPGIKIISANHNITDYNLSEPDEPIKIGNNVWMGANSIILPGVSLPNNCIVGAGSVVTKSYYEDNIILAGNPARIICKTSKRVCEGTVEWEAGK